MKKLTMSNIVWHEFYIGTQALCRVLVFVFGATKLRQSGSNSMTNFSEEQSRLTFGREISAEN